MKVEAVMRRTVITVRPDTPLRDVARILVEHRISGVPVVGADGGVLGVVSETDFVVKERGLPADRRRTLLHPIGERPDATTVSKVEATTAAEAMTSPAVTVEPTTGLQDAARLMTDRRVNRLPVVHEGRLVGILTRADIVRAFVRTDDELRAAVIDDVVRRAMWLDETAVDVTVADGIVHVTGTVERRSEVPILERLIGEVPGVVACRVDVTWRVDDTAIRPEARDLVNPPFGPA